MVEVVLCTAGLMAHADLHDGEDQPRGAHSLKLQHLVDSLAFPSKDGWMRDDESDGAAADGVNAGARQPAANGHASAANGRGGHSNGPGAPPANSIVADRFVCLYYQSGQCGGQDCPFSHEAAPRPLCTFAFSPAGCRCAPCLCPARLPLPLPVLLAALLPPAAAALPPLLHPSPGTMQQACSRRSWQRVLGAASLCRTA